MPTSRAALGFLAFGALLGHPLAGPAQPEARDEVVDIVYWDEVAGPESRRWAFITGFITEFDADGHIRGTRSATFKYDAAYDGPGPPMPEAAAYYPAVHEPLALGDTRRAVAMALDESTGDIYIAAPAGNPGRAIIKYDKNLLPAWASPVRSLGAVNGEPVEISLDPDRGLVVVGAGDEVIVLDAADGSISRHMPEATNPNRGRRPDRAGEDRVGPAPLAALVPLASPDPHPVLAAPSHAQNQCEPVWSGLNGGADWEVRSLAVFDEDGPGPLPPALFAGGGFSALAGVTSHYVARWDGWAASTVGDGLTNKSFGTGVEDVGPVPEPLATIPAGLYVGGTINGAGGVPVSALARWLSPDWHDVGGGVKSLHPNVYEYVFATAIFDEDGDGPLPPALFVGGIFSYAGDVPVEALSRWDGENWSAVGGGLVGSSGTQPKVRALEVFDDDGPGPRPPALYIGGSFHYAAGMPAYNIVRWDGKAFEPLGGGLSSLVQALCIFDEDGPGPKLPALFAAGTFSKELGNPTMLYGLGRWDGNEWSSVGGWQNSGGERALFVWDADGPGPAKESLYVGGLFSTIPGYINSASKIGRWDGEKWWPLGAGLTGFGAGTSVSAIAAFDEDGDGPNPGGLYVGGLFGYAGGVFSKHIARWGCPLGPKPCYADCDKNGTLDIDDFLCFQTNFALSKPAADCDGNSLLNIDDFLCFQLAFALGC